MSSKNSNPDAAWNGLIRERRTRPIQRAVEAGIFFVALSAIVMVFLIFVFVAREALPVFLGQTDSSAATTVIAPDRLDSLEPAEIQAYLELSPGEFAEMNRETWQLLMEVKLEAVAEAPDHPDASLNTSSWRFLLLPFQWAGYEHPEFIWQPVSQIHKYNIVPLLIGSLKVTAVSLLFAVPLSMGAAIFVSQLAGSRLREMLKPCIELLAGIPSVVLGFFALIVMASALQSVFGYESRLNTFVAGIALGFAVIPVIFSIAEDALTSVPASYTQAALALGSSPWQAAWGVVLPAALPGVFAAVVLGFGRAIGETMIVLMASGNASIVSADILDSARTMTATIAAELAEAVFGGHHYQILFMLGTLLFLVTFLSNVAADWIIHRLKRQLEGRS